MNPFGEALLNYFQLFDLPISFSLDVSELKQRHRELQRNLHPDRFANATEQEQRVALQRSSAINDGVEVLSHPLKRAEHFLVLNNVSLESAESTVKDTQFLMEQMALRERLEEVSAISDLDDLEDAIELFTKDVSATLSEQLGILSQYLDSQQPEQWQLASVLIRKLSFFYKLLNELKQLEDKLL